MDPPPMPANRIRWIAWTAALVGMALIALSGRSPPPSLERTGGSKAVVALQPPELFRIAGPLEAIPAPAAMAAGEAIAEPVKRPVLNSLTVRDPQSFTGTVIREPRPQTQPPQAYVLREADPAAPQLLPQLPFDLLLNGPKREQAPVVPRAADRIPAETKFGAPPSPLPMLNTANPAMQPVNDQARSHVQRGFSLGDRAAIFAARTEFIQAMRTVTQAVDAQAGFAPNDAESCSQALAHGLHALDEADDFAPEGSRLDGDLDLAAIVASHRTPACKAGPPATQLAALQAYFDYAREQLARAAAGNPVSSQALAGLGKSYTVGRDQQRLANAKAMVFHQAAVATDPANHLAANELGVLLARYGQWEQAKQSLLASLRVQPDPNAWQNLAQVHARLGENDLAVLAEQERKLLLAGSPNVYLALDGSPTVQWVDPQAFAGPPEEALASPAVKPRPAPSTASKSDSWSWLPWR